jgi:hypothetical protein
LPALLVTLFVTGLFYYWFAVANRYVVFLYGHTATNIPPAQPFDALTRSRYWMAGLVAAGLVLPLYAGLMRIGARVRRAALPSWPRVWALCALPLALGLPAITLTANTPTLPLSLALGAAGTTLAGLVLALWLGTRAAEQAVACLWLLADGAGLVPPLLALRALELPGRGLSLSPAVAWGFGLGSVAAGAAWLGLVTALRAWRRPVELPPSAGAIFAAGSAISYLCLPALHYLLGRPPYRYVTAGSNFFAFTPALQVVTWALAAGLAYGFTCLRQSGVLRARINQRREKSSGARRSSRSFQDW